jgi:hypothetical protein
MSVDTGGRRAAQALLQASERLGPPPDLGRLRRRRRRRTASRATLAVAAVLAAVAVAVTGGAVPGLDWVVPNPASPAATPLPDDPGPDRPAGDAVAVGKADASDLVAGTSGVWLLNHHNDRPDELVRVDPGDLRVAARIDIGYSASTPAVGEDGSLFAVRPRNGTRPDRPELVRVDPATNRIAATVALPSASRTYGVTGLVAARGLVWVAYPGRGLVRVDPASGTAREVRAGGRLVAVDRLALAGGWLWAAKDRQLHRVDPRDGTVAATVGGPDLRGALPAAALAGGAGGLWLHGFGPAGEQLLRLDPVSGRVEAASTLSRGPGGRTVQVDLGAGDRLVAVRSGSRLLLADPDHALVRATMPAPGTLGAGMAVDGGLVWLSDPARGRLLRIGPAVLGSP